MNENNKPVYDFCAEAAVIGAMSYFFPVNI
jgi:hypothetical protein